MLAYARPTGLPAFLLVWMGQVISLLGSAMTWFALMLWAWQTTGAATAFALVSVCAYLPTLLFSPLAGALVDRWNRKLVMMLGDLATATATLVVLLLYITGQLQVWHLCVVGVFAGSFTAFQFPAYAATATVMLPPKHLARAQGLMGLAQAASGVFAPLLAAGLWSLIGVAGIMTIDLFTFVIALSALLWVNIPQPAQAPRGPQNQNSLWQDSAYGLRYIFERRGLLALQVIYSWGNFCEGFGLALIAPMILARTANNEVLLGSVQSIGAVGGITGGLLLSLWGGPKRRVHAVLIGWALSNMLGLALMGLGSGLWSWAVASFCLAFLTPFVEGCNQAFWQTRVPVEVQGRVFGTKLMLSQFPIPVAMLIAGPLVDHVFEPAMRPGSRLAAVLGGWVGTGAGAGMSLLLILVGLLGTLVALSGYAFQTVRRVEEALPDQCQPAVLPLETSA
jgi:MFS family permease